MFYHFIDPCICTCTYFVICALLCCRTSWSQYDDIIGTIEGKGVAPVKYVAIFIL